ncbi:UvrD-helicase domain-containing protein [Pendulispora albinea]|uniref:DNA 3'-5' helicase n=1 Tax=Pendulispora albinea TaxID=2741071 RepID=A0ABZ2M8R9_9BACT
MTLLFGALDKPLGDAKARQRIREDLDTTLVVEAAAGTGKTTELVGRVLSLVKKGKARLSAIVAVTFTEKAAGEMKLRLRTEIEKARSSEVVSDLERKNLDASLAELEAAHIGTIHGFCADLLRERPVEACVDPLFEVADDDGKQRILHDCFEPWFEAQLAKPLPQVERVLRRRSRDRDAVGPRHVLTQAVSSLIEQRDFDTPWSHTPFDRRGAVDDILEDLRALGALAPRADYKDSWLAKSFAEIARYIGELDRREAVRGGVAERDYDGLEAELRTLCRQKLWGWKGSGRYYGKGLDRQGVLDEKARVHEKLKKVLEQADADLAAGLRAELWPLVGEYEARKRSAGKLDFLDLLLLTRNLLRDHADVRRELQQRFTHLLVDEFQDTDPLQAEILLLLAASDPAEYEAMRAFPVPGKLFVVGDPKQSIYRFRRADVALYESIKRHLEATGADVLHLSTSFRSLPAIQKAVNAAFEPLMQGNARGSQATYVPLQAFRDEPKHARPSIVALPVPRPWGDFGKIVNFRIDDSFPDAVGAFVHYLLSESGWTIAEREGGRMVPLEARHVCLLFKRLQNFGADVTRPYVRALEARRIPHVLVGGRSYHAREEVVAIVNALSAIEWPDDELSVFATLRGPFFSLGDDALLAFRHRTKGELNPFRRLDPELLSELTRPVRDAMALLAELHRRRNRRPIADTIVHVLEATRAHAGIAIWPTGEQALANVLRVLDIARRFESRGATSFRSFVEYMKDEAHRGGVSEAPVVEEGTDGVRIMTVHRAKGLEFPVVILADPTAKPTLSEPSRYVDASRRLWAMPLCGASPRELLEHRDDVLEQDGEEALRLLYVAATRARELLVVPALGDEVSGEFWTSALNPVIYPYDDARRASERAPGCPEFGPDSVRERPEGVRADVHDSVKPGLHRPRAGDHHVVWWDPAALGLDKHHDVGLRQQRILEADKAGTVAEAGERLHALWRRERDEALAHGGRPSRVIHTVTEVSHQAEVAAEPGAGAERGELAELAELVAPVVEMMVTDAPREGRPRGKRFGTLVHAALAVVDLLAVPDAVRRVVNVQARLVGANEEEIEAAAAAVVSALRHPIFERARDASECRRESPILCQMADGSFLEGVLDLAFRERDGQGFVWTVVDYKTDAGLGSHLETVRQYEAQVALYLRAVSESTHERARGVLLSV